MKIERGILALSLALMPTAAPALDTLGGGGSPQELVAIETPTAASCNSPISVISAMSVGTGGAKIALTNPSLGLADESLRFEVTVDGDKHYVWTPVTLASGQSIIAYVRFIQPVTSPIITVCGNKPIGIVETPDPIVGMTPVPPPSDDPPVQPEEPIE